MVLDRAAAHRLRVEVGDEQAAGRRGQLCGSAGDAGRGVEARLRAPVQLGEVGPKALPRVGMVRVDRPDLDGGGGEQPLDGAHGVDEPLAALGVEGSEHRLRELVASLVEQPPLGRAPRA